MTKDESQKADETMGSHESARQCAPQATGPALPAFAPELLALASPETDLFLREIAICLWSIFATNDVSQAVVHQATVGLHRIYLREQGRRLERLERLEAVEHGRPPRAATAHRDVIHPAAESLQCRLGW